jgi:alkanesulfonate monooxygenase
MAAEDADKDDPYWLGPFENYRTFCPYLVGSYERVAQELQAYIEVGYGTFILDIPPSEEELQHTSIAFQEALVAAHAM